jgi:hypothetical protein
MSRAPRALFVHVLILTLATGSAGYVWLRDKAPAASVRRDVVVWHGRAADVSRIEYKRPLPHAKSVILEGKTDATGRYWIGTGQADGPPITFVSVGPAQKIADKLGDLRALRDLGHTDDAKSSELGLKKDAIEGSVVVTLRGEEHTLELGASAPGDTDRYVRDTKSGEVFVVEAEPIRQLEGGDHTLVETELHEFPLDPDVDRVTVSFGGKKRALVRRGMAQKRFFADGSAPETNDETATTWMAKVERLHATEFITGDPPATSGDKLRLEYATTRSALGFLEVVKSSPLGSTDSDVFIRTERTRLWAKVARGLGDQVLGDVGSIVR